MLLMDRVNSFVHKLLFQLDWTTRRTTERRRAERRTRGQVNREDVDM